MLGRLEDLSRDEYLKMGRWWRTGTEEDHDAWDKAHQATLAVYKELFKFMYLADLVFSGKSSVETAKEILEEDGKDQTTK